MGTLNVSEVNDLCPVCASSPIGEKALGVRPGLSDSGLFESQGSGLAHSTCSVSFPQMKEGLSQDKVSVIRYRNGADSLQSWSLTFLNITTRPCLYHHCEHRLLHRQCHGSNTRMRIPPQLLPGCLLALTLCWGPFWLSLGQSCPSRICFMHQC